jgi:ADP-ribosyl-[dinitrogen reductase] hydrolase
MPSSKSNNLPLLIGVSPLNLHDRYLGAMFGLAIGDAVGTTLEFKPPGTFSPIKDMVGGGPFGLAAGQWTDDTSMALCLAESLIHAMGSNPEDPMLRYVAWWKNGHLSSTGKCFDIGGTTSAALSRFMKSGDPMAGSKDAQSAGNGSLMRLAPIPLAYRANIDVAIVEAARSSRTTHAAAEAVDACRFMTLLMVRALQGASKEQLLHEGLWDESIHQPTGPLAPKVRVIAKGSYKAKKPPALRGTGYVVDCLEAALWAFCHHHSYEQAVLAAANLGDDADTTATVCGQLAGAHYGLTGIPAHWIERVTLRDTIAQLGRGLLLLSRFLQRSEH